MDRAKLVKATIVMILIVALIIGYYVFLSSKNDSEASNNALIENVEKEMTPVQEIIARSKYKEYPSTPVQVVKYYNEITRCYYNETYSEEELNALAGIELDLLDMDLVLEKSWDQYYADLKAGIDNFKAQNITIYSEEVTSATDVEFFTHNGYECAKLYCTYTLKSGTSYQPSKEVFILRKDEDGHWKIFGFKLVKE